MNERAIFKENELCHLMEWDRIFQHADGQQEQDKPYKEGRRVRNTLRHLFFRSKVLSLNNSPTPARHVSAKLCRLHHMCMKKPNFWPKPRNFCSSRENILYNYILAFLRKFVEEEEDESTGIAQANEISSIWKKKVKDFCFLRNATREITPCRSTDNSSQMPSCGLYRNTN